MKTTNMKNLKSEQDLDNAINQEDNQDVNVGTWKNRRGNADAELAAEQAKNGNNSKSQKVKNILKVPLFISELIGTFILTYLGTCSVQNMENYSKIVPSFKRDRVVCFSLAHMLIYTFFIYGSNISAECCFNPVISFVKIVQGRFTMATVGASKTLAYN